MRLDNNMRPSHSRIDERNGHWHGEIRCRGSRHESAVAQLSTLDCKHDMFKKIMFTVLWVIGCILGSVFLLEIATATLVAEKIKGFQPSEFAINTVMAAWFVVPLATITLTLILCIRGKLPGTRSRSKSI
jgi:hypothetical protein